MQPVPQPAILVKSRPPTREEMNDVADLAKALVKANKERNPTSKNATLGEEDALFMLRWKLNELAKAMGATRAI